MLNTYHPNISHPHEIPSKAHTSTLRCVLPSAGMVAVGCLQATWEEEIGWGAEEKARLELKGLSWYWTVEEDLDPSDNISNLPLDNRVGFGNNQIDRRTSGGYI